MERRVRDSGRDERVLSVVDIDYSNAALRAVFSP